MEAHICHHLTLQVISTEKLGFFHQTLGHPEKGKLKAVFSKQVLFLLFPFEVLIVLNMTNNTKLDEKLEGAENFRRWKYRIMLILEENGLEGFIKKKVAKPEEDEVKVKHKKDMIKAKRIKADSIKDHLIPHVSSRRTPKEMFDTLSNLF